MDNRACLRVMGRASAPGGGTADDALAHWRGDEDLPAIERELEAFARGDDLDRLPRLQAVICGAGESSRFVGAIVVRLVEALSAAPLAAVPMRHFFGPQMATLQLAEAAGATLSLHVLDRSAPPSAPETACFVPLETWDRVICGDGVADLAVRPGPEAGAGPVARCAVRLEQGHWYSRAGIGQAVVAFRHDRPLVFLRLQRRMAGAMACEYRLADGALLRRAAGNLRDSRHRLAVALLGAMRRRDAVPALAELATGEGAADLRWQALREAIGLDSGAGFAALGAVANDVADPLQPPAAALRERLIAAHPALAQVC